STEMRAGRIQAQEMAKLIFEDVRKTGRKVSDRDVLAVLRLWAFKNNDNRQNVMKEGVTFVHSDTLGLLAGRDGSVLVTAATTEYKEVTQIICKWLEDHTPKDLKNKFCFSSINVNSGYAAALHRDANNEGPSMIKALGKFSGGELNYWGEDDKSKGTVEKVCQHEDRLTVDICGNLLLFDGNRGHSVEEFEGERFSLVFFTNGQYRKADATLQAGIKDCGINFPTEKSMDYFKAMMDKPIGYVRSASAPKRSTQKIWRQPPERKPAGADFTSEAKMKLARTSAFKRSETEWSTECSDTEFIDSKIDHYIAADGRRGVRVCLVGASGKSVLVVDTIEDRKRGGHYKYEKLETFPHGPSLSSHRIADVRDWISAIVKPGRSKAGGTKRCLRNKATAAEPSAPPTKRARGAGA
ncbi:unnamed protein product, partial [Polarella glacialis]